MAPDRRRHQEIEGETADRRPIEGEVGRQTELLGSIIDHIPVMISVADTHGHIRLVNREWERVLGWTREEILAQDLDILAACYPDLQDRQAVHDFVASSNGEWRDFRTRVKDGRTIDTSWAVVRLSGGTRIGIGRDLTERKQEEEGRRTSGDLLRALSARVDRVREEEGTRIARELHDELGAALTTLRWDLEALERLLDGTVRPHDHGRWREKLGSMTHLVDTTVNTVRRLASELRPDMLTDLGLTAALEWQVEQFASKAGISCHYHGSADAVRLDQRQSTAVFRIFQEALTNIRRHAQATRVDVAIGEMAGEFVFTVADNGRGIAEHEKAGPRSLGLLGMRERAHLAGGVVDITEAPGGGTLVIVRIPTPVEGGTDDESADRR
jgi:PAS domain S-box-containing protein